MINLLVTGGCGFIGSNFINHYFQNMNKSGFDLLVKSYARMTCGTLILILHKEYDNSLEIIEICNL